MSRSTTKRKRSSAAAAVQIDPFQVSVDKLAQDLRDLNQRIEPTADAFDDYQAACALSAARRPSPVRMQQAIVLQYQGLTFIALSFDSDVSIELLKLSDLERSLPLLVSFGLHTPGNIATLGQSVFAFTTGIKLQIGQMVQVDAVFSGGKVSRAVAGVSDTSEESLLAMMGFMQHGQRLLDTLLVRNQAQSQILRDLIRMVAEFSHQYEVPYTGSVDLVQKGLIEGWLWCPWKPQRRYEVQAWCQGRLLGYARADQPRDDLLRKRKSDGRLKFSIKLSDCLNNGKIHWIQLKVMGQGEVDRTLDFEKPIRYKAVKSSFDKKQDGLMGYDLDQKVAMALGLKFDDPDRQAALLEIAPKISLHLEFGETERVRELVNEVVQRVGHDGFITLKLAESHLLDGSLNQALSLFSQVVRKARKFIWGHLGLAHVLLKLGRDRDALTALENAHALSPYYPGLKQSIESLSVKLIQTGAVQQDPRRLAERIVQARSALIQEPNNRELGSQLLSLLAQKRPQIVGANLEPPVGLAETANLKHTRALLEAFIGTLRKK